MIKHLYRNHSDSDLDDPVLKKLLYEHQSAMTGEDLNSKAEIATELAVRDREILRLKNLVNGKDINGNWIKPQPLISDTKGNQS